MKKTSFKRPRRKNVKSALLESEKKYKKLLDTTSEGFWLIDADKKTTEVNDSFCKMLGYTKEEMLGKTPFEFVDEENKKIFIAQTSKITTTEHRTYEIALTKKNGEKIHTIFNATTLKNDAGEPLGGFAFITNIDLQKNLEADLKLLNENLSIRVNQEVAKQLELLKEKESQQMIMIQQSKMADMGEMISAITHQWKQPLNILSLLISNFVDENEGDDCADFEKHAKEQITFMSQTISDFRNFFKPSEQKIFFSPLQSIGKIEGMFGSHYRKEGIMIGVEGFEDCNVLGYPNEFKQVLLNIFNNMRDVFMERGIKEGKINCASHIQKDKLIIRIKDNGGGVPSQLLPDRLFEAYVSTKGEQGTGIGLKIAKTIIEDHMHGKLWAHNHGGGAEFVIELPLY